MNARRQFAETFAREHATTRRVLHALPASKSEFMPYVGAPPARVVAAIFSQGQWGIAQAMSQKWTWPPAGKPGATDSYAEVLAMFDATGAAAKQAIKAAPDGRLDEMVPFIRGPNRVENIPVSELIWFMLLDGVHHRGQFSVYLRAAGEKVPSIYGPTAHEPWM
ncbi:MAG: DinB family protein [Gemmatimonadota bacterium]|nr:DinB family protein [Gemmatimonadota bacterium]